MRVGQGYDVHRLGGRPPVILGGVVVDRSTGVIATSDGDVLAHAVIDALLGAAALGDLGSWFGSDDERWVDAESMAMLGSVVETLRAEGLGVVHVDGTVVAESIRVAPHREAIRAGLAEVLGVGVDAVSVKATSTDGVGAIGAGEAIAAFAVVLLDRRER